MFKSEVKERSSSGEIPRSTLIREQRGGQQGYSAWVCMMRQGMGVQIFLLIILM